jgi:hypothetical protein
MRNMFCHRKTILLAFPIFRAPLSLSSLLVAAWPRRVHSWLNIWAAVPLLSDSISFVPIREIRVNFFSP